MKLLFSTLKSFINNFQNLIFVKLGIEPKYITTSWSALQQWKLSLNIPIKLKEEKIIFFATRNKTWVEWSVFASLNVFELGFRPFIVFSGKEINELYKSNKFFNFWESASKVEFIQFINIDNYELGIPNDDKYLRDFAKDFAHTWAAYDLKLEEYEEDFEIERYNELVTKSEIDIYNTAKAFEKILDKVQPFKIISPSGLIAKTIGVYAVNQKRKNDTIFIEGWARRRGHLIWSFNQPALFYDIHGWLKVVGPWDSDKEMNFKKLLSFQDRFDIIDEEWFKDFVPVQRSTKYDELPNRVLTFMRKEGKLFVAGTNVIGDSATLKRSSIFKNQKEWLRELINFFQMHKELKLIIRAHPDEAVLGVKNKIKLGEFADKLMNGYDNILIIHGYEDINTYQLIEISDVFLAWVSNVGIDAVVRKKPVILAAKANYSNLGICKCPNTKDEYFKTIEEYSQNPPMVEQKSIITAKLYQQIVFKEMSLEATGKSFNAYDYRLGLNKMHKDKEKFYKIITGDLS